MPGQTEAKRGKFFFSSQTHPTCLVQDPVNTRASAKQERRKETACLGTEGVIQVTHSTSRSWQPSPRRPRKKWRLLDRAAASGAALPASCQHDNSLDLQQNSFRFQRLHISVKLQHKISYSNLTLYYCMQYKKTASAEKTFIFSWFIY